MVLTLIVLMWLKVPVDVVPKQQAHPNMHTQHAQQPYEFNNTEFPIIDEELGDTTSMKVFMS